VSDPAAAGSVVFFHHPNGTLGRVVPLERLNPGRVLSVYHFPGDLGRFEARLARMRSRPAPPAGRRADRGCDADADGCRPDRPGVECRLERWLTVG
jgi:hypothetical protein